MAIPSRPLLRPPGPTTVALPPAVGPFATMKKPTRKRRAKKLSQRRPADAEDRYGKRDDIPALISAPRAIAPKPPALTPAQHQAYRRRFQAELNVRKTVGRPVPALAEDDFLLQVEATS